MADLVPWDEFEIKYAQLFPSDTGNIAKPLRMALGALIIQTKFQFADRELVEQITENPYLQYFIGLPGYQEKLPFDASTLVDFRKRISAEMLMEANEYLLGHKDDNDPPASGGSADSKKEPGKENEGTLILDATCAPANIRYPQDVSLLNEAREKLETIERISFEAYNESTCLIEAVERYKERTGYYPERVLADQIYRTRDNRNFCRGHKIRLSGPKLGRPSQNAKADKKQEYEDNTDRIEVERAFSLDKCCYGMGLITTKLEETQLTSIALSVFVSNLFKMQRQILFALLYLFQKQNIYEELKLSMSA